jgi:uncharacterized membrane protein
MMDDHSLTDQVSSGKLKHATLYTGVYTGALLILVMIGALVAANRIPGLERFALERNAASYGLFVMFMLIPVCRFLNRPVQMFTSAMIGWVLFVVAYNVAGLFFQNLYESLRHTPFVALIEGAVVYGVCAVGSWVGAMVLHARTHPILSRRRRTDDVAPHHQ